MNRFNNLNLSTKLNIIVCSAIIVCFLGLGSFLTYKTYHNGIEISRTNADYESTIATKTIEKEFEKIKQELIDFNIFLMNGKELFLNNREEYSNLLDSIFESNNKIIGAYIIWADGTLGAENNRCKEPGQKASTYPYMLKDADLIQRLCEKELKGKTTLKYIQKTGEIFISEPYILETPRTRINVISIINPIFDEKKNIIGATGFEVDISFLMPLITALKKQHNINALITPKGLIIAHTGDPEMVNKNIFDAKKVTPEQFKNIKTQIHNLDNSTSFTTFEDIDLFNDEALVVVTPLEFDDSNEVWYYYTAIPKSDALNSVYQNIRIIFSTLGLTLLIIIPLNILFIEKIITPRLYYLVDKMKRMESGKFDYVIEDTSVNDELGILQRSAKSLYHNLKNLVENLESLVTERTSELNESLESLELANKHKDKFLSSLSHELRTPLNSIMVFSDLLNDQVYGPLNEKQLKYIRQITSNSEHLSEMITDLLDITRIETGKILLNYDTYDINELLEETINGMNPQFSAKKLLIEKSFKTTVHSIETDKKRFKQILINLLTNATKFTPEDGTISIHSEQLDETSILIKVFDTGIGISQDQLKLIFSEFYQVSSKTQAKLDGLGLGLAISRRLVHLLGGEIFVESSLNNGSTFSFSIPLQKNKSNEGELPTSMPLKLPERKKVLVLENNKVSLGIILDLLQLDNQIAFSASNAPEALEIAQVRTPDALLFNANMPDLDINDFISKLKSIDNLSNIPVIAMVSDSKETTFNKSSRFLIIEKPVTRAKVIQVVSKIINLDQ